MAGRKSNIQKAYEARQEELKDAQHLTELSKLLGASIKNLVRASQGQPLEDDSFAGLIHVQDPRERARLSPRETYRHSLLRVLAAEGPAWDIYARIADQEDTYSITKNGEQWEIARDILKSKTAPGTLIQNVGPATPSGAPAKKPGFWARLKGKSEATEA